MLPPMTAQIKTNVPYYGFILTELVQWELTSSGHLVIYTLEDTHIYIAKDRWRIKHTPLRALILGTGKIEFNIAYKSEFYALILAMNPVRESRANEETFYAGRNGPFNLSSRPLTAIFGRGQCIDPDKISASITEAY